MLNPEITRGFQPDEAEHTLAERAETKRNNEKGLPVPASALPKMLYGKYYDKHYDPLPDYAHAGPWHTVSKAVHDVMQEFDLGGGGLYPVEILQADRETPVEGTYFHRNFGNTKEAFLPEYSKSKKPRGHSIWRPRLAIYDNDIAVCTTACNGPDIWIDTGLRTAFFMSGRLVQALKDAKLADNFHLRRCKLMQDN